VYVAVEAALRLVLVKSDKVTQRIMGNKNDYVQ
jgi:hypothetical protein